MKGPCKECTERHTACHDTCEKFAQWREEHEKAKAWLRKENENIICTYAMKMHDKALKRGRR